MKRTWSIVGTTIFWCAVVAYFVCAALLRSDKEHERTVESVEIVVKDADQRGFITPDKALRLIEDAGLNPVGKSIDSIDISAINSTIEEYCFTSKAVTYLDYEGTLTVELTQRTPLLRVRCNGGYDFYLTKDGYVLPVEPHATLNLPIVTGSIELPFGNTFKGDLGMWAAGGEKKYSECYDFLSKLTNFVVYLEESKWQGCKCVQINLITPKTQKSPKGAFVEPQVELIPQLGNYVVELGRLEQLEDKIYRWRRFVESGVVDMNGGVLNVEYDSQALWKAPMDKTKTKKNKK